MLKYAWAINKNKLERATIAAGADATEEQVKAKYIAYAGLLREDAPSDEANDFEDEAKPKKAKKKAETEDED